MNRIVRATVNSWKGLRAAAASEAALREEIAALVLSVPAAFLIAAEPWKRAVLVASVLFVIVVELLNTAIEKLSDHVTSDRHPRIGMVKDMGSAAVGGALALAGLLWLVMLGEYAKLW